MRATHAQTSPKTQSPCDNRRHRNSGERHLNERRRIWHHQLYDFRSSNGANPVKHHNLVSRYTVVLYTQLMCTIYKQMRTQRPLRYHTTDSSNARLSGCDMRSSALINFQSRKHETGRRTNLLVFSSIVRAQSMHFLQER